MSYKLIFICIFSIIIVYCIYINNKLKNGDKIIMDDSTQENVTGSGFKNRLNSDYIFNNSEYIRKNIDKEFKMKLHKEDIIPDISSEKIQKIYSSYSKYTPNKIKAPILENFSEYAPFFDDKEMNVLTVDETAGKTVRFKNKNYSPKPNNIIKSCLDGCNALSYGSEMTTVWDQKSPDPSLHTFYNNNFDKSYRSHIPCPSEWEEINK